MKGVEFEEEQDLIRSPEPIRMAKPSPISKKLSKFKISKSEAQGVVMMMLLALLIFAASGFIISRSLNSNRHMGSIIPPESLTEVEKYQLPEKIRAYIK